MCSIITATFNSKLFGSVWESFNDFTMAIYFERPLLSVVMIVCLNDLSEYSQTSFLYYTAPRISKIYKNKLYNWTPSKFANLNCVYSVAFPLHLLPSVFIVTGTEWFGENTGWYVGIRLFSVKLPYWGIIFLFHSPRWSFYGWFLSYKCRQLLQILFALREFCSSTRGSTVAYPLGWRWAFSEVPSAFL